VADNEVDPGSDPDAGGFSDRDGAQRPRWVPPSRFGRILTGVLPEERARQAILSGDVERGRRIGVAMLKTPNRLRLWPWNGVNRLHWGHIVLGLTAVGLGDVTRAEQHLLAAGSSAAALGGSPQLNTFGPDFDLAGRLVDHDRRSVVLVYLESCRLFWTAPSAGVVLDAWAEDLRRGGRPNLRRFASEP
jgi:hypothetical protein